MTWTDRVFGLDGHLSWSEECARAVLIFFYGLALVRIAGRRVFGKWSALDIIASVIIGSNLSRALTGSAPLWGTLAASTLLMALHWLLAQAAARSTELSRLIEGRPVRISEGGELKPSLLKWHSVSDGDLNEALRQSGVERIADTQHVTLEPSGKITVTKVTS